MSLTIYSLLFLLSKMNFLPKEIENIIIDYKEQIEKEEHKKKFNKTLENIKNINYFLVEEENDDYEERCYRYYSSYFNGDIIYFIYNKNDDLWGDFDFDLDDSMLGKLIVFDGNDECSIVLD